jgi:hypothetical protein
MADETQLGALSDVGIIERHGTMSWTFKAGQREVSSSGGSPRERLADLLRQTAYLIDDQARRLDVVEQERAQLRDRVAELEGRIANALT